MPIVPDQIDVAALKIALGIVSLTESPETFVLAKDQATVALTHVPNAEPIVARNGVLLTIAAMPTTEQFSWTAGTAVIGLGPGIKKGDVLKVVYWYAT